VGGGGANFGLPVRQLPLRRKRLLVSFFARPHMVMLGRTTGLAKAESLPGKSLGVGLCIWRLVDLMKKDRVRLATEEVERWALIATPSPGRSASRAALNDP
jgi:hypothetical protein